MSLILKRIKEVDHDGIILTGIQQYSMWLSFKDPSSLLTAPSNVMVSQPWLMAPKFCIHMESNSITMQFSVTLLLLLLSILLFLSVRHAISTRVQCRARRYKTTRLHWSNRVVVTGNWSRQDMGLQKLQDFRGGGGLSTGCFCMCSRS